MKLLYFLPLVFTVSLSAQNLVVNPGFEAHPYPVIQTWPHENPPGTPLVDGWVTPTPATPDFWNSDESVCDGFPIALARTGEGRCGIISGMGQQLPGVHNYKEYVQGTLTKSLEAGKKYNVSFYLALDCSSPYTTSGIGAYFSSDAVRNYSKEKLNLQPQVITYRRITYADGWARITGSFTAKGGEKFITIGSFSDTAIIDLSQVGQKPVTFLSSPHIRQNVYFYIDDVCVSPASSDSCLCQKEPRQTQAQPAREHYLFLLDVSNSMNDDGKLKMMKAQIRRFADSLGNNCEIGIMTFSNSARMMLPFCSPSNKNEIAGTIRKIKANGTTNGDLAIRKVSLLLDSLKLPGRCHVILATDGIFALSEKTRLLADSSFARNNASFCVLQFGQTKNTDLEGLTRTIPESSYHLATDENLTAILDQQVVPEPVNTRDLPSKENTVYYTSLGNIMALQFFRLFLESNPDDGFDTIPRK